MNNDIRNSIDKMKNINEGSVNDFKYDLVKSRIQQALNNNSITLSDIKSDTYFILAFGMFNQYLSTVSVKNRNQALDIINNLKNNDEVWKIYVEKPTVDASVFLRNEKGWIKR